MRGRGLVLGALGALVFAAPAAAQDAAKNVEHLKTISEAKNATAINFLEYERHGKDLDVMLVTGRFGLKAYSLDNPAKPQLLDELSAERLKLEGDPGRRLRPAGHVGSGVDVLAERGHGRRPEAQARAALARPARVRRDRRRNSVDDPMPSGATNIAGVYVVDARDPEALRLLAFQQLPTGHTTSLRQ